MSLSVKQASALLGVAPRTMYSLAAPAGPLPCYRVGRRVIFERDAVEKYKASCRALASADVATPNPYAAAALQKAVEQEARAGRRAEEIAAWQEAKKREAKALADGRAVAAYLRPERRASLVRHHAAKRRLEKINRTPVWANQAAIRAIYAEALRLTKDTGVMHHVDHIIPLQGALVSGLHVETNLQVLPWRENVVKHNHFEVEA